MHIEIHGLCTVIHRIPLEAIKTLCDEVLMIKFASMIPKGRTSNCSEWYKPLEESDESVLVKKFGKDGIGYTILNLHGSFFDKSPDFRLVNLFMFLSDYEHTYKQLDIAYNDDGTCLLDDELDHWIKNYNDYFAGSLVSVYPPKRLSTGYEIEAIRFCLPKSNNLYATIYKRPNTELWRVEIKIKDKEKILTMLKVYNDEEREPFNKKSRNLLFTCIRVVTPSSKRSGNTARYKTHPVWEAFLVEDYVTKIVWSRELEEKRINRAAADIKMSEKKLKNSATRVVNTINRVKHDYTENMALQKMSEYMPGYRIVKDDSCDSDNVTAEDSLS